MPFQSYFRCSREELCIGPCCESTLRFQQSRKLLTVLLMPGSSVFGLVVKWSHFEVQASRRKACILSAHDVLMISTAGAKAC